MSLENRTEALGGIGIGDYRSGGSLSQSGKVVFATTTLAMDINDLVVRCDSTDGAFTVTLPSVREAAGRIYSITLVTDNGNVTIEDKDGDAGLSDISLTAANDYSILYSDGYSWRTLVEVST